MINHNDLIKNVDILKLAEYLKLEGQIRGHDLLCCCPLPEHDDKNPSFRLGLRDNCKGLWYCFSCGAKGNTIHLIQRVLSLTEEEAIEQIGKWFGFPDLIRDISVKEIKKMLEDRIENEVEEEIIRFPMPRVEDDSSKIINYLLERKYNEAAATKIYTQYEMKICQNGYYRDRVIIPIHDSKGDMVMFEATTLDLKMNKMKKLYPSGSPVSKLLFNNHRIQSDYVCVCEGIFDAIKLNLFELPAVSTFGASVSLYQTRMLINKYNKIYIMFDGDKAGKIGSENIIKEIYPYLQVINIPLRFGDPENLSKKEIEEIKKFYKIGGKL